MKVMHFIWGGPPMPDEYVKNLCAWADLHPNWEFIYWSEDDLRWLEHQDLFDNAARHVPADAVWQFRSDIARYEILNKFGGLYVDADVTPLRSIEPALEGHDTFAVAETRNFVANTILFADRPHHLAIEDLVSSLRRSINMQRPSRPNVLSGPVFLTPIWRRHRCHVAETELFFPLSWRDAKLGRQVDITQLPPETFTYHDWGHVRSMKGRV